ncbi:MAG TPA: NAD-dependent epimerase/dehydratase family protein [Gemmatimonadaceae bacterium]|jgi:NADH dehydrogenase|nr:NAD-dependent epimerase/dehydratase family protein [Gemmatimonadaceae bacterium]
MQILVTGGSGVVGVGAVTELLRRGHRVRLLARHADDDARQWASGVTPIIGDVADAASIAGAADGCDAVLHVAGIVEESPPAATFERVNVNGTRNVCAEAERAGVGRLVYVSSLGAPEGASDYHRSKRDAERLVEAFRGNWTICRPGNVYGPGDGQISVMLRLVRAVTPIVPTVGSGSQSFQPIWWEDLAKALAAVVERNNLAGEALDLAGTEVTCQNDLHERMSRITGREVTSVPVPEMLATLGAKAISMVGWKIPFSDAELQMLREGNVIRDGGSNALVDVLRIVPTPLEVGLRRLAEAQPEQLPGEGIGTLKRKRYWGDIVGGAHSPETLFELFRTHFDDVTPVFVDAKAEPRAADVLEEGETLTLALPMRGHVQVRCASVEERRVTLLTLEGHPLAGAVRFLCEPRGSAVRFQVEVYDRPANVIDFLAMRTVGDRLQDHTWSHVVERMVELSGGSAPAGVEHETASLDEGEAKAIERWVEEIALRRKRAENEEAVRR